MIGLMILALGAVQVRLFGPETPKSLVAKMSDKSPQRDKNLSRKVILTQFFGWLLVGVWIGGV